MKSSVKIFSIIAGLLGLFIVAAIAVPFLVDFSHFKPQIQDAVASKVNAKIDFSSARLHIFPSIGIRVKDVVVENTDETFKGTKLFSVDEVFIGTRLMPLLRQKVEGRVEVKAPSLTLAKMGLKNNLAALSKPSAAGEATPPPETPPPSTEPQQAPSQETLNKVKDQLLIEAVDIQDALLTIKELTPGSSEEKTPVQIKDLDLLITNIGLERDIKTLLTTDINISQPGIKVTGPLEVEIITNAKLNTNGLEQAAIQGKVDLDRLDINVKDALVKAPKIPLNTTFSAVVGADSFTLKELIATVQNLQAKAQVQVDGFKTLATKGELTIKNNDLAQLGTILPQHKDLLQKASIDVDAKLSGALSDLTTVHATVDGKVLFTSSDIAAHAELKKLSPIAVSAKVDSKRLDLDALLGPFLTPAPGTAPAPAKEQKPAQPAAAPASETSSSTAEAPPAAQTPAAAPAKDFALTAEQKKMLQGADIGFDAKLDSITFKKINLEKLVVDLKQKGLTAHLNPFSVLLLGGSITARGDVDLDKDPVAFQGSFSLSNIQPEKLTEIIAPEHRDILQGRLNVSLEARGRGTSMPTLEKTLAGKGTFKISDGHFNTPSIAEAMQVQFDNNTSSLSASKAVGAVFDIAGKVLNSPLGKILAKDGKNPPDINKLKAEFENVSKVKLSDGGGFNKDLKGVEGKIEIEGGRIKIISDRDHPAGKLSVNSSVGLDMSLGGSATYVASEGTKKRLLAQSKYAELLFDKQNNLVVKMNLSGTVQEPKVALDLAALRETFPEKAKAMAEKELRQSSSGGNKDAGDEQKKQAQDDMKKKAEEEAAKLKEEASKRLKGIFGN